MMQRLEQIDPISAAKTWALVQAILALAFGLIGSTFGMITVYLSFGYAPITSSGMNVLMILVVNPLLSALTGLLAGLITSLAYNAIATRFGGIRIVLRGDQDVG